MNHSPIFAMALLPLLGLAGCNHKPPTHTVCLLDVSQSITLDGIREEFAATDALVERMNRGDNLTVIPIMGNAANDLPGHVLHLDAPIHREPYDHDLVLFREQAHAKIHAMQDAAMLHPSKKTDILGTLGVARQESEEDAQQHVARRLVVMSDFLEDDGELHFSTDASLSTEESASGLAKSIREDHHPFLDGTRVRLCRLQSRDLGTLAPRRIAAVDQFWKTYFEEADAKVDLRVECH